MIKDLLPDADAQLCPDKCGVPGLIRSRFAWKSTFVLFVSEGMLMQESMFYRVKDTCHIIYYFWRRGVSTLESALRAF